MLHYLLIFLSVVQVPVFLDSSVGCPILEKVSVLDGFPRSRGWDEDLVHVVYWESALLSEISGISGIGKGRWVKMWSQRKCSLGLNQVTLWSWIALPVEARGRPGFWTFLFTVSQSSIAPWGKSVFVVSQVSGWITPMAKGVWLDKVTSEKYEQQHSL